MNPNYFSKGFTDIALHERFMQAVHDGDLSEISALTKMSGSERPFVDAAIMGMNAPTFQGSHTRQVIQDNRVPDAPEFGSSEYIEGMRLVMELAKQRDLPLDQIDAPERGYKELSPFLMEERVKVYKRGVDYGTDKQSFKAIQAGRDLAGTIQYDDGTTGILTGRDAAAYVHTDNPVMPWARFVNHLQSSGVATKMCSGLEDVGDTVQSNFVLYGAPFMFSVLGRSLAEAGWGSFYCKWRDFAPRPEEAAPVLLGEYLPLAFPEGSPMHCSDPSMHSIATEVCKEIALSFFDGTQQMPMYGGTVQSHADLLADNVGFFRVLASVHFPWEHRRAGARAKAYAQSLTGPLLA